MDRPSRNDSPPNLHTQQVHVLYRNMPTAVLASAVNAAILAAVEWSVVPHTPLLLWVLVLWIVAGGRALLIYNYRRAIPSSWSSVDWSRWMLVGTTASGIGWGSSAYLLSHQLPLPYEVVHIFVLGGMTAGAVSVLSVFFPLFIWYALSVTLPILAHLFLSGHEFHLIMGLMGVLFLLATIHSAWNFNRVMFSSMSLRKKSAWIRLNSAI